MKTNTAVLTMIVAMVAMIGMTGSAMAASTMDYTVEFDAVGTGSVTIATLAPIGTDFQQVVWTNCGVVGHQDGDYGNDGWMEINRDTRIDTAQNTQGDHSAVFGSILTQSQLNTDGGSWTPGTVLTYMTLNDSYIGNPPEDYMELDQSTQLYDGDMQNGGTVDYEQICADTYITARLFDNAGDGSDKFSAAVVTTTDATTNASSAVSATLQEGEIFMSVNSILIDDAANAESSGTDFYIDVPNMPGYTEQNTGSFGGQAAINGIVIDYMQTTFVNVDNINTIGYFYAVTL